MAKRIDADEDKILIENEWTYTFTLIAKEIYDENLYPNLPIEFTQSKTPVTFVIQDINVSTFSSIIQSKYISGCRN